MRRNGRDPFSYRCTNRCNPSIRSGRTTRTPRSNRLHPLHKHFHMRRSWRCPCWYRHTSRRILFVRKHNPARTRHLNKLDPPHTHCRRRRNAARPTPCRHTRPNNRLVRTNISVPCSLTSHHIQGPSSRLQTAAASAVFVPVKFLQSLPRITSDCMGSNRRRM